jgi:hypothetical protein
MPDKLNAKDVSSSAERAGGSKQLDDVRCPVDSLSTIQKRGFPELGLRSAKLLSRATISQLVGTSE